MTFTGTHWPPGTVPVKPEASAKTSLKDTDDSSLTMAEYQGGDLSPEGDKLFIVTGFSDISTSPHGIHVFNASTSSSSFRRIQNSMQSGLFQFSQPDHNNVLEDYEIITATKEMDSFVQPLNIISHCLFLMFMVRFVVRFEKQIQEKSFLYRIWQEK